MSTDEAAIYDQNPVEYIIPFAQMSLVNGTFLMDIWNRKIEYNQEEGAINPEVRYDESEPSSVESSSFGNLHH